MKFKNHIKKLIFLILILTGAGLWFYASGQSDEPKVVKVGIYQNPPKIYLDENKNAAGIFIEILSEIAKQENWELVYVPAVWNECLENLQIGNIDVLPDVAFTAERNKQFDFNTIPVLESWTKVYVGASSDINKLSDLDGKRIAVLESSVNQLRLIQILQGYGYHFELVMASSFSDAFSLVKTEVADAAVTNHFFGEEQHTKYGLKRTNIIFNPALLHFATCKGQNEWILEAIDKHMLHWIETPGSFYYQVTEQYINNQIQDEKQKKYWWMFINAGVVILSVSIMFVQHRKISSNYNKLLKANQLLQTESEKFRSYIEFAPIGILVANEHKKFIEVNRKVCSITGYSETELADKTIFDLTPEKAWEEAVQHFQRVVKTGKSVGALPFLTKEKEQRFWTVKAVKISENRFIGFVQDITDEIRDKERLDKLGKIFDLSKNEIYLFNQDTLKFVEVNPAALKNTGYSVQEILNLTPLDLKLDLTADEFIVFINQLITGEKKEVIFETRHYRKDKTFYDAEIHLQLIDYVDEKLFSAIVLDVSDRKNAESELISLKTELEKQVNEKTGELKLRLIELENFHEATIERELRMEELRKEIETLKKSIDKK